jgi:hypothetical protein
MKMKGKILAIWVILLLITIPLGIVQASETNVRNDETFQIEIASINEDEQLTTETLHLSKDEFIELEKILSNLIEKIQEIENLEDLQNIIDNFEKQKTPVFSLIFKILSKFNLFRSRAFVFSRGHGFKLNPFKKSKMKIKENFVFWHYSSGGRLKDKTIFFKPFEFKMKILKGIQFGFMSKFTGLYIFVSKKFPEKSVTYFIGTAKRIGGIQLLPSM